MRTALVTGASSGIGAACASRLISAGWRVFAGVRRAGDAPRGAEEILLDVTDESQIRAAANGIEQLDALCGGRDLLLARDVEQKLLRTRRRIPGVAHASEDAPPGSGEPARAGGADAGRRARHERRPHQSSSRAAILARSSRE